MVGRRSWLGKLIPDIEVMGKAKLVPNEPQEKNDGEIARLERQSRFAVDKKKQFMDKLYRSHWDQLCAWLLQRYGAGPPEPEDIAQAAFEKVASVGDQSSIQNPKAFLFATAVNTATNSILRIARARQFFEAELRDVGRGVEQNTPETVFETRKQFETLNAAIQKLPEKQREILVRSRVQGETYIEIRAATGWSKAAISRQLNAALASLQKAMDEVDGNS